MNRSRPKIRLSRSLGLPLTPKSVRYFESRPYPPGQHGRRRRQVSDYSLRLREKQRLRAQYNVSERQLRNTLEKAQRKSGKTGENLIALLESRLDATVLRTGFARTIYQARQFVTHRHVTVNDAIVDKPSFHVQPGDVISIRERSRGMTPFIVAASGAHADSTPGYLDVITSDLRALVVRTPSRSEVPVVCNEQLVVEFYAR